MSSLPTGGWTTYSAQAVPEQWKTKLVWPAMICALAFGKNVAQFHSTPCCRIDQASFA